MPLEKLYEQRCVKYNNIHHRYVFERTIFRIDHLPRLHLYTRRPRLYRSANGVLVPDHGISAIVRGDRGRPISSHTVTNKQRRSRRKPRRRVGPSYPSLLSVSELRTRWTGLFALPFGSKTRLMASVIPRKKPRAKTGGTRHIVRQVIRDEESRTRPLLATDGLLVLLVGAEM